MSVDAVNQFWCKVDSDRDFQTKFVSHQQMTLEQIVEFAEAHGFRFSEDDLKAAAAAAPRIEASKELSDAELEAVVGGAGAGEAARSPEDG